MKKLLFISFLIILSFSCKKERLKDNKELLVGKWQLEFTTTEWKNYKYPNVNYPVDTIFPNSSEAPTFLEFEKNGKVKLIINGEEEDYKVNFKSSGKKNAGYFSDLKYDKSFRNDTGWIYYGSFYEFKGNFYKESNNDPTYVEGIVNQDKLRIDGGSKILTIKPSGSGPHTDQYFIKV